MSTMASSSSSGEIRCVPHLKLVLVGGRNSGKSLVGNMLLGREEFVTRERTTCSRRVGGAGGGQPVTVVDTPGWWCDFSVHDTPQQVKREIRQSVALCLPGGPHAFLLVVKATSAFSGKRRRAVEEHLGLLGERVWSYCLVVFTRRGWSKNASVERHLERGGSALRWLGEKCGGRCHAVDLEGEPDGARVAGLFEKIKRLVVIENGGGHFEMGARILQEMEERKRTVEDRAQQRFMKMKRQRSLLQRESRHLRDIRIVLLGARWSGKSSAGNAILGGGGGSFATGRRTARCATRSADVSGRRVTVVDTPGWWMNYFSEETTVFDRREVVRGLSLCPPGPNALLLVVRADRAFTETYRRSVQEHVELTGERVWTRLMVVFSFGDWLGEAAIERYIESEGDALRWLVEKCGNRYHVLDNKSDGNGFQIAELMGKIEEMVAGDGGGHFEIRGNVLQELTEEMKVEEERAAERLKRTKRQRDIARSLGELHCPSELRLVLLGTANTGKSSAGNTILGREQFDAGSPTLGCVEGRAVIRGHSVTVLDTPGRLCAPPEFPASAVVIPLVVVNASSSFTRSQRGVIEKRLDALGEEARGRAVVLFTFGDWLGNTSVERRVESEGRDLRELVDRCRNRYHVLDNKNRGTGGQVGELLEKIAEMMAEERLEVGGQVGRSIRAVRETQFDGGTRQGPDTPPSYTENPDCDASEVAGLVNLLPPIRSEEQGVGNQMALALPAATGGRSTPAQLLLDREGVVVSRLASLLRGSEGPRWGTGGGGGGQTLANVQNFPDAWLRTEYRLDRVRRRRSGNPVGTFGPRSAVVVLMRAEQPGAEDTTPVARREEFEDAQALIAHPGLRDRALRERVRSGGLQALIDQWGNSNLEELESFIDSYFQRVWEETMSSVMTEEESVADGNRGREDVVEEEPGAGVLSSVDGRLSRLDIVETMQGDLVELKQILECSLKIIQELNDRCTTVMEPSV